MDLIIVDFNTSDLIYTYSLERRFEYRGTLRFRKMNFFSSVLISCTVLVFYSIDISRSSSHS